jgi:FtsZ-binding cell division protein ZapB
MSDPILDKLDAKLKSRIDALQASEKNVFDDSRVPLYDAITDLQSCLTAAEKERDEAQARIKELEKDSEILDWMEEHNWSTEGAVDCIYSVSIRQWVRDRAELDKLKGRP